MTDTRGKYALRSAAASQRGVVLISSLLLLMIVTIFAVSMFHSFGIQERIAGNTRDKERARGAAMTALQYAEWWITQNNFVNAGSCTPGLLNANANQGLICLKNTGLNVVVPDVTVVPWTSGVAEFGTVYTPPNMNTTNAANPDYYFRAPRFSITFIGYFDHKSGGCGNLYQIDAWGNGSSSNTVAVVESTIQATYAGC
ncbi:MAG TPA: PilX N-terminal domain-containing pilus assembly protein [Steroidobacteraceae bacterium]|nr:PilX N-terminal domain-containing pilus assembly protein [Steroidobacteraceae bacterium]